MNRRPRIGVVGCGALGSFYAARLSRAGFEVHCVLRSDFEAVRAQGIRIVDAAGGFVARPAVVRDPGALGVCDWVIIGLKTTANGEFARLVGPLVGPDTRILTLQNGLGNEEALAALFGEEKVFGGLCVVCLNRLEPGVVHHLAHGLIVMGEFRRPASGRVRAFAEAFGEAEVECRVVDALEEAHWEKLVWNIPFNGLGVGAAAGLPAVLSGHRTPGRALGPCWATDQLLGDPDWERLVRELMAETLAAARAQGLGVREGVADEMMARTVSMGPYRASTLIDFERGLPLEVNSLFAEPLRRARAAGVATPRLAALCSLLSELDGSRPGDGISCGPVG